MGYLKLELRDRSSLPPKCGPDGVGYLQNKLHAKQTRPQHFVTNRRVGGNGLSVYIPCHKLIRRTVNLFQKGVGIMRYSQHFSTLITPQSESIPGKQQVQNNAGGYVFALDKWKRLDRFLILGSDSTYYVGEHELTQDNAKSVLECIAEDGPRVVGRIVEISEAGRAPKNDPALFALALCASMGDEAARKTAFDALPRVARIGTHLFTFLDDCVGLRGWGRGLRRAVGNWYNGMAPDRLAFQLVKYRQRGGWTHADALRLAHPVPANAEHSALFKYAVDGDLPAITAGRIVEGFVKAQQEGADIPALIRDYGLTWEMVPTEALAKAATWEALLPHMPLTAMIRNLGNMSKSGLLAQGNWDAVSMVVEKLADAETLRASRVHPLQVLAALSTYSQGHGFRGHGEWEPVPQVVDALDSAFYAAFGNVTPTGKRIMLALDVSGSMGWGELAGVGVVTPRVGSAAMALVTMAVEKAVMVVAFSRSIVPVDISPRMRLDDVCRKVASIPMGGTDCALPMLYALERKIPVDATVIYTDNETWAGGIHPCQALARYRCEMGAPAAKLVTVGMTATGFTIADPDDAGMLDVCGFDTATPNVISDFMTG